MQLSRMVFGNGRNDRGTDPFVHRAAGELPERLHKIRNARDPPQDFLDSLESTNGHRERLPDDRVSACHAGRVLSAGRALGVGFFQNLFKIRPARENLLLDPHVSRMDRLAFRL